ncbi:hypothetical protein LSTR_LSTR011158 [Laodelphax striatellus]|uniref:WD repeat-containing protein 55 homolog n=1 Tax=Laodelphax striatellus TaxID=195883 RepID=A0A482XR77_LAOST|nr:hypothetical protein LSTR_LSTR011158 [Laodelphax striatellus]
MCNIKPSDSEEDILSEVVEATESDESDASTSIDDYYDGNEEDEDEEEDEAGSSDAEQDTKPLEDAIKHYMHIRNRPPEIECDGLITDISFHPKTNALAAACISGDLFIYKYDVAGNQTQRKTEVHTGACRAVEYSHDGQKIFTVSKDKSIVATDSETGQFVHVFDKAHSAALFSISIISEHLFATGDEDGAVKLWDIRHEQPILSVHKVKDYISSIVTNASRRYLACTTGEGTVVSINIVAKKFHVESEPYESELTCAGLYKDDGKLVCGTATGQLLVYNWAEFGLHVDEFPGSVKKAINCQVPLNDNIMLTGWEDGKIRATHIHPNKHLGVIGQHQMSVDSLDISHDGTYVASCSLDEKISFWPVDFFNDIDLNVGIDKNTNLPSSQITDQKTFFADLADS